MSLFHAKIEGVPQFVSYFPAVGNPPINHRSEK